VVYALGCDLCCDRYIPLKCWYACTKLHSVTSQETIFKVQRFEMSMCVSNIHILCYDCGDKLILVANNETRSWPKCSSSLNKHIIGSIIQRHCSLKHRRKHSLIFHSFVWSLFLITSVSFMDKVALGQVCLWALELPRGSVIPPVLHTHSVIHNWCWQQHYITHLKNLLVTVSLFIMLT